MRQNGIPEPDFLIAGVGSAIYYSPDMTADEGWSELINFQWNPRAVKRSLAEIPGLAMKPTAAQSYFRISYDIDPDEFLGLEEVEKQLYQAELSVNLIQSFGKHLDLLPVRASKGYALRYVAHQWDIPLEKILVSGGSGADEDMLLGNTLGVVVSNRHDEELTGLADSPHLFFSRSPHAAGIMEAIEHYDFLDTRKVPEA